MSDAVVCPECEDPKRKVGKYAPICGPCHRTAHCLRCLAEPKAIMGLCFECHGEWRQLYGAAWSAFLSATT